MLRGRFQRGTDSRQVDAQLWIDDAGDVSCPEADIEGVTLSAIDISPRIGNSHRYLNFPGGGCFETKDNDIVDQWIDDFGHASRSGSAVHRLEANIRYVIAAALFTMLFAYGFVTWGVPWLATRAAYALPAEINESLGQGTLAILDRHLLEPSQLPLVRQREIVDLFAAMAPDGDAYNLQIRFSGPIGANAFALPDGTVILTDGLIALADNDEQIAAVMLHEIGHVVGRHGLRGALQNVGLATLLVLIAGDVSSANSLLVSLPTVLVSTSYSRDMETEADRYAVGAMLERNMDAIQLIEILSRLETAGEEPKTAGRKETNWLDYLSTHPLGKERMQPLRELIESGRKR